MALLLGSGCIPARLSLPPLQAQHPRPNIPATPRPPTPPGFSPACSLQIRHPPDTVTALKSIFHQAKLYFGSARTGEEEQQAGGQGGRGAGRVVGKRAEWISRATWKGNLSRRDTCFSLFHLPAWLVFLHFWNLKPQLILGYSYPGTGQTSIPSLKAQLTSTALERARLGDRLWAQYPLLFRSWHSAIRSSWKTYQPKKKIQSGFYEKRRKSRMAFAPC